jgi:uncharacterized lipoprotein
MKILSRRLLLIGTGFFAVTLLSGCASTKGYVSLSYVPQANVVKINGADVVTVHVDVTDLRSMKDKVGAKRSNLAPGMDMAAIIATEDVADTLKRAIEVELANRGFRIGGGGMAVAAELSKFYNDFKTGFWSGSAVAEVIMNVQVTKADGSIGFSRLVTGAGGRENLQLGSASNAKVALDAALKDALGKLFGNTAFVEALLQAARP